MTLNIWSKASHRKDKPVFVFFYGEVNLSQLEYYSTVDHRNCQGWTIGATNTAYYDGQYLADVEDVVVVTLNYRLGKFGPWIDAERRLA